MGTTETGTPSSTNAQYADFHKQTGTLIARAAKLTVNAWLFTATTIPKAEKLAKEGNFDEANEALQTIEARLQKEQEKLGTI